MQIYCIFDKYVCVCVCARTVWSMSIRNLTSLGSKLASVTDLKRIQTPRSLNCVFGGNKTFITRWWGGRVQVWVQVWAPAGQLAISSKAVPKGYRRFRGQNQWPSSWGSSPALLERVRLASTNTWCSESAAVAAGATGSLQENMLQLLRYWLSWRFEKIVMLCKFRVATSHFFFMWNEISMESVRDVADQSSAHCFVSLSFCHWSLSKNMT